LDRIAQVKAGITTSLAAAAMLVLPCGGCGVLNLGGKLTAAQQGELDALKSQLADPTWPVQSKVEAAEALAAKPYPQAKQTLLTFLAQTSNPAARVAVAQAVSRGGLNDSAFVRPLLEALSSEDAVVVKAAGLALAGDKGPGAIDELLSAARDRGLAAPTRIAAVRSLERVCQSRAIDAMIDLLDDSQVQKAAAAALAEMTGVRAFGRDRAKWKQWWDRTRFANRTDWLAGLADRFGKTIAAQQAESAALRERLTETLKDLYDAAPAAQQEAMLLDFLADPLADVRLVGVFLAEKKLSANQPVSEDVRAAVDVLLADSDPRCRRAAALLYADLGKSDRSGRLLSCLAWEQDLSVRQGLLAAIGQLRSPDALPAVVKELASPDEDIATAAAEALGRIVEASPLGADMRSSVSRALGARYSSAARDPDSAQLREALLAAMGAVGGRELVGTMERALRDKAAAVRQAAVAALAKADSAGSVRLLEPLVGDGDRGVRQAAISAIGALGGDPYLDAVLDRTEPPVEGDPAVRKIAWEAVMSILKRSDPAVVSRVADRLSARPDAADQRITVLQMLTAALKDQGGGPLANAERQLGLALMSQGRPAEAGPLLAEAWRSYAASGAKEAPAVWLEWVDALLAAEDPAVATAMNEQEKDELFASALARFNARLGDLQARGDHAAVILLASAAFERLPHRLTPAQIEDIQVDAAEADKARALADRQEVAKLVAQLRSPEEQARKDAASRISALGPRAVEPLLQELKLASAGQQPDPAVEAEIVAILGQLAPDFKGYEPASPADQKAQLIDQYLAARK